MKMKKLVALLTMMSMFTIALVGCGGKDTAAEADTEAGTETETGTNARRMEPCFVLKMDL